MEKSSSELSSKASPLALGQVLTELQNFQNFIFPWKTHPIKILLILQNFEILLEKSYEC